MTSSYIEQSSKSTRTEEEARKHTCFECGAALCLWCPKCNGDQYKSLLAERNALRNALEDITDELEAAGGYWVDTGRVEDLRRALRGEG